VGRIEIITEVRMVNALEDTGIVAEEVELADWMMYVCRPPQPDCELCRLAQSLGQVVYCRCMTQSVSPAGRRQKVF